MEYMTDEQLKEFHDELLSYDPLTMESLLKNTTHQAIGRHEFGAFFIGKNHQDIWFEALTFSIHRPTILRIWLLDNSGKWKMWSDFPQLWERFTKAYIEKRENDHAKF